MMESINVDVETEVISHEDNDYSPLTQHVVKNVLNNEGDNLQPIVEDDDSRNDVDKTLVNRGSSSRIQKNHPIENIIGDLNERTTTQIKEPVNYK